MSSARGSTCRTRPQKHQNKTAFKNNLHDKSKKTKVINSLEVTGVCERCQEIIEWKIKYKKYKPLTAPKKCVGCEQKTVKQAYHVLCTNCSTERKLCAKCHKPFNQGTPDEVASSLQDDNLPSKTKVAKDDVKSKDNRDENRLSLMLASLPERKRRIILRYLKNQEEQPASDLETLFTEMKKFNLDNEDSDLGISDSESICDNSDNESFESFEHKK